MGSKSSSPPPAPNPAYVAQQQTQSNVDTAVANSFLNNINQRTPQGSLTYRQTGVQRVGNSDVPQWEAVTELSPEQRRLYDTTTRISQGYADLGEGYTGQIRDATKTPFSYAGMPGAPTAPRAGPRMAAPTPTDVPQYNDDYRSGVYNKILDRNAPRMERDRAALEQRLANQGIPVGSEASRAAWDDYNRGVSDYRLGADLQAGQDSYARYAAELAGQGQGWGQQAQRFGLDLQADNQTWGQRVQQFGLEGSERDRAISDALRLRMQPINEASALFNLGGGVRDPQFVNTPQAQISPTDVSGIYANNYAGQMAAYNQQMQQQNGMMGGLFGLGSALAGGWARSGFPIPSDARIKENVVRIASAPNGLGIYAYNHIGESTRRIGLMAQEVEKVRPEAVVEVGGIKHVDYEMALCA